jgi:copper resistance protein C
MRILPVTLALLLLTTPAFAHAHLVSEMPAENTSAASPSSLSLEFSESVVLKFTGITLTGPSGAVSLGAASLDPKESSVLVLALPASLPAGSYTVAWHALSSDGHKTTGSYSFTVN